MSKTLKQLTEGKRVVTRDQLRHMLAQHDARYVQGLQLLEADYNAKLDALAGRLAAVEPKPVALVADKEPVINAS